MAASSTKLHHEDGSSQAKRMKTEENRPFVKPGEYDDEVSLVFNGGETLYVCKAFLFHMSPVFVAMFDGKSDFKEKKTNIIEMEDKKYDDMLLLLLSLHPRTLERITGENVFRLLPLAMEYMIDGIIESCRRLMFKTLVKKEEKLPKSSMYGSTNLNEKDLTFAVEALLNARKYNFEDVCKHARGYISHVDRFPTNWKECYEKISDGDKLKIMEARMQRKGDTCVPK